MTSGVTLVIIREAVSCTHRRQRTQLTNVCVLTAPPRSPASRPLIWPPFTPRRDSGRLRAYHDLRVFKGKEESLVSHFKSKLETMELSEEGVSELRQA